MKPGSLCVINKNATKQCPLHIYLPNEDINFTIQKHVYWGLLRNKQVYLKPNESEVPMIMLKTIKILGVEQNAYLFFFNHNYSKIIIIDEFDNLSKITLLKE